MPRLALTVVSEAPGLEHGRTPDRRQRPHKLPFGLSRRIGRGSDAERHDEVLFGQPILRDGEHPGVGKHRFAGGEKCRGFSRDVFELVGNDVDVIGETIESGFVSVVRLGNSADHIECR